MQRHAAQLVSQRQSANTMARPKRSYVCCYFSSTNSQNAVLDVYGKKERSCGNTRKLVKHLRLNHNTGYEAFRMRRSEEESRASGAAVGPRQTSLAESFGTAGRHYPGTEGRYKGG